MSLRYCCQRNSSLRHFSSLQQYTAHCMSQLLTWEQRDFTVSMKVDPSSVGMRFHSCSGRQQRSPASCSSFFSLVLVFQVAVLSRDGNQSSIFTTPSPQENGEHYTWQNMDVVSPGGPLNSYTTCGADVEILPRSSMQNTHGGNLAPGGGPC